MWFSTPRADVKIKGKKHKHSDRLCLFDRWSHKRGPAGGRINGTSNGKGAFGPGPVGWSPTAETHGWP